MRYVHSPPLSAYSVRVAVMRSHPLRNRAVVDDVLTAVRHVHVSGVMHDKVMEDLERWVGIVALDGVVGDLKQSNPRVRVSYSCN